MDHIKQQEAADPLSAAEGEFEKLPQSVREAWLRNHLEESSDDPVYGTVCLLKDAANAVSFAGTTAYTVQAVPPELLDLVRGALELVQDALAIATTANREPKDGTVELLSDGSVEWHPPE